MLGKSARPGEPYPFSIAVCVKMVSSRKIRVSMPSIPIGVDPSSQEINTCSGNGGNGSNVPHRVTTSSNGSHTEAAAAASVSAAPAAALISPPGRASHNCYQHLHNNMSDLSDDNNNHGSDEDRRGEKTSEIMHVRSPPSVKVAVATALEAERKMELKRAEEEAAAAAAAKRRRGKKSRGGGLATPTPRPSSRSSTTLTSAGQGQQLSPTKTRKKSGPVRTNTSGAVPKFTDYVGVSFSRARNQWQARVCILQKQQYCGRYRFAADAAKAYDDTIKKLGLWEKECNFANDEEYERARKEEVARFKEVAQRGRERMLDARAAAGLGDAVASYERGTSGAKREVGGDFRNAATPPPPAVKKRKKSNGSKKGPKEAKAAAEKDTSTGSGNVIVGDSNTATYLAAVTGPIDSDELKLIVEQTELRMKSP